LQRVGGQLVLSSPKTRRSRRVIPLPRAVVKVLRAHRESQAVERATADVWGDHDLVFTTTIGTAIEPRNLSRHFEALREEAKVRKVRLHDLRHSCASLLFELGVPLRMVMVGHSQISTTSDIYTHVMPAQYREVADTLDAWLGGRRPGRRGRPGRCTLSTLGVHGGVHAPPVRERRRPRSRLVGGLWPAQLCPHVDTDGARSEGLEPPTF
jgi:hypothetical protein